MKKKLIIYLTTIIAAAVSCDNPTKSIHQASEEEKFSNNYPTIKESKWIDSFIYEDYDIGLRDNYSNVPIESTTRFAVEGHRFLAVEADLYFPTGTWDLTRIALRSNDDNDHKLLAFSYSSANHNTYSLAEKGETLMLFGNSLRRAMGPLREPNMVAIFNGWPGAAFSIGLIFEVPNQSLPTLLLHGDRSQEITSINTTSQETK